MKNKIFVYVIVVSIIIFAVSAEIYLIKENKFSSNGLDQNIGTDLNTELKNDKSDFPEKESIGEEQESGKLEKEENNFVGGENETEGAGGTADVNGTGDHNKETGNALANDYFSINLPQGWKGVPAPVGISAMAINTNEEINDPVAKKMNFKSYLAIIFDSLQERSKEEYVEYTKNTLEQTFSALKIVSDRQILVNGEEARAIEIELTEQGCDFKTLIVLVWGKSGDVWQISFNTTMGKWEEYQSLLNQTINSFQVK